MVGIGKIYQLNEAQMQIVFKNYTFFLQLTQTTHLIQKNYIVVVFCLLLCNCSWLSLNFLKNKIVEKNCSNNNC